MKKLEHSLTYSVRVIIGLIAGLTIAVTSSAETLMVYTAVEAEDLKRYAAAFNEDHPDIKIRWVRDSTGIVTAKLAYGSQGVSSMGIPQNADLIFKVEVLKVS